MCFPLCLMLMRYVLRQPLVLARYPNIGSDGKPQFMNIAKVINSNTEFQYKDSR